MAEDIKKYHHLDLLFPGKYLKGAELEGKTIIVTIDRIDPRQELAMKKKGGGVEKEMKPVLYFVGKKKGMVMNKTNGQRIAALYGKEVKEWIGKSLLLHTEKVKAGGQTHDALRFIEELPPKAGG